MKTLMSVRAIWRCATTEQHAPTLAAHSCVRVSRDTSAATARWWTSVMTTRTTATTKATVVSASTRMTLCSICASVTMAGVDFGVQKLWSVAFVHPLICHLQCCTFLLDNDNSQLACHSCLSGLDTSVLCLLPLSFVVCPYSNLITCLHSWLYLYENLCHTQVLII